MAPEKARRQTANEYPRDGNEDHCHLLIIMSMNYLPYELPHVMLERVQQNGFPHIPAVAIRSRESNESYFWRSITVCA